MTAVAHRPYLAPVATPVAEHIDVTDEARRLGWRWSVRLTAECWTRAVHWDETIEAQKAFPSVEEPEGRLRNVLWLALCAARVGRGSRVWFDLDCVPPYGAGVNTRPLRLVASVSPGPDLKPIVTIDLA